MSGNTYSAFSSDDLMFDHKIRTLTPPPKYKLHCHNTLELFFLKKGDVTYITEKKQYHLSKNTLVISRPLEHHMIRINDLTEYERYVILFDEGKIGTDFYHTLSEDVSIVNFDGNALVLDLFRKFDYYKEHLTDNALKEVLSNIIKEIICNISIVTDTVDQTEIYSGNALVTKAQKYIQNNITSTITVNDICKELYITPSHLHHLFTKHLNTTPKQYILAQKMFFCKRDLCDGQKPIEVCQKYGFTNYSTFYRIYKKHFGHSPGVKDVMWPVWRKPV